MALLGHEFDSRQLHHSYYLDDDEGDVVVLRGFGFETAHVL